MGSVISRAILAIVVCCPLASCAFGAAGTIGVHYATDRSVRVQFSVPFEIAIMSKSQPVLRSAAIPRITHNATTGSTNVGGGIAVGPVFHPGGYWLAPAVTIGATGGATKVDDNGSLDVGVALELAKPYSNGGSCEKLKFNSVIVPQISLTRRVYDSDHPLASRGGDWDIGVAAGLRHTHVLECGNTNSVAPRDPRLVAAQ